MDEYDEALDLLRSNTEIFGVATIKVADGQMFMFSKEFIWSLVKQLNESDKDKVLIFVKKAVQPTRESLS